MRGLLLLLFYGHPKRHRHDNLTFNEPSYLFIVTRFMGAFFLVLLLLLNGTVGNWRQPFGKLNFGTRWPRAYGHKESRTVPSTNLRHCKVGSGNHGRNVGDLRQGVIIFGLEGPTSRPRSRHRLLNVLLGPCRTRFLFSLVSHYLSILFRCPLSVKGSGISTTTESVRDDRRPIWSPVVVWTRHKTTGRLPIDW